MSPAVPSSAGVLPGREAVEGGAGLALQCVCGELEVPLPLYKVAPAFSADLLQSEGVMQGQPQTWACAPTLLQGQSRGA